MTTKKKINKIHIWTVKPGGGIKKVEPKKNEMLNMIVAIAVVVVIFVGFIFLEYKC